LREDVKTLWAYILGRGEVEEKKVVEKRAVWDRPDKNVPGRGEGRFGRQS